MRLSPTLPVTISQPPPALPRARLAVRVWRVRRRIGILLLLSALLHLVLLLVLVQWVRPPERGAVSPQSFDLVMEPASPLGKAGETKPTEIPAPALPAAPTPPVPEAPHPPAAAVPPPPAALPPLAALEPAVPRPPLPVPMPAAPLPATSKSLPPPVPPAPLPQPNPPQADAPVRLAVAQPPQIKLPPAPPFTMPEPPPELPPAPAARPAEPAFPTPMNITLGPPIRPQANATRGTGAIDLTIGRAARETTGTPPRDTNAAEGKIHVRGANPGKDWMEMLFEWWEQHSDYPRQAALRGEDGSVQIHVKVDPYGRVQMVEVESPSGSQWLDMGALATFRGQQLPQFPRPTPEGADLDITIDYILVGKGAR